MEEKTMKGIRKDFAKLYSFFYFLFWGFYFSAGYFYCKNTKNSRKIEPGIMKKRSSNSFKDISSPACRTIEDIIARR